MSDIFFQKPEAVALVIQPINQNKDDGVADYDMITDWGDTMLYLQRFFKAKRTWGRPRSVCRDISTITFIAMAKI